MQKALGIPACWRCKGSFSLGEEATGILAL